MNVIDNLSKSQFLMTCLSQLEELGYNIDFEYDEQTCDEVVKSIAKNGKKDLYKDR